MEAIDGRINADEDTLHVVYFLSRKGRIEHPHLIRVHHFSDLLGVRLKDVKQWISDVRGKEMPDKFAWSYKRRYKTGYIWQDLHDNDAIVPIYDKEYVLKGSEISATSSPERKPGRSCSLPPKTRSMDPIIERTMSELSDHRTLRVAAGFEPSGNFDKNLKHGFIHNSASTSGNEILNPFGVDAGLADSFSDSSATDDDSTICCSREASRREKQPEAAGQKMFQQIDQEIKEEVDGAPKSEETEEDEDEGLIRNKKKERIKGGCSSMSSRAYSRFLRSFTSCRAVETKDSAVRRPLQRHQTMNNHASVKNSNGMEISAVKNSEERKHTNGSARWKSQQQQNAEKKISCNGNLSLASVQTPLLQPTCSQCGKRFNPERLDAHMRACKGMKTVKDKKSAKKNTSEDHIDAQSANLTREESGGERHSLF